MPTITKSRGSKPRSTETPRTASDILATAISTMLNAVATASRPSGLPSSADAVSAASRSKLHLAAEEAVGADAAEDDVGVGHSRLGAAAAVADRPGRGAGAVRTDLERADLVDPGDAAAAGADLDDVDHRHHGRMAVSVTADVIAFGDRRLAAVHQAGLGGGAAHVEGDRVFVAEIGC